MAELSQIEKDGVVYGLKDQYLRSDWETIFPEQTITIEDAVAELVFDLPEQKYNRYRVCFEFAPYSAGANISFEIHVNGLRVLMYGLTYNIASTTSKWNYLDVDVQDGSSLNTQGSNAKNYNSYTVTRSVFHSGNTPFLNNSLIERHGTEYKLRFSFAITMQYAGSIRLAVQAKQPID